MIIIPGDGDVRFDLGQPLSSWADEAPDTVLPLAARLLTDCEDNEIGSDSSAFSLPLQTVAAWPESIAKLANLPPNCPLGMDLRLSSGLGQRGASLAVRWLKPGTALPVSQTPKIEGLIIDLAGHKFRLNEPLFSALTLVREFNEHSEDNPEEQFRLWARIREHLGEDRVKAVTENFLRTFRVVTADSFTFSFETDRVGNVQLVPALMVGGVPDETGQVTKSRALTEVEEEAFSGRLDDLPEGASAFPLKDGTYVVVTERLQKALSAVRQLRRSPPEQRKRAVLHPEAVIAEMLGDDFESGDSVFVETERYSERVLDVAEWVPPIVPWIKVPTQKWLPPSSYGFKVGGVEITLQGDELQQAIDQVNKAIDEKQPFVEISGQKVTADTTTSHALISLQKAMESRDGTQSDPDEVATVDNVLVIQTNFEEGGYSRVRVNQRPGQRYLPQCLRTQPKEHQTLGIEWLQSHWCSGSKGALLADDMGLGKTFQALTFLAWLRELMTKGELEHRPILIVAPVGLLRTWEAEHRQHLSEPGLGEVVRAYGEHVRELKRGKHREGTASLDGVRLGRADWILANYETVSEYQLTFGAIRFAAVIFDEAQKIKSPKARMTHAAKALNADFVLAMTGTPIENRLADLWCVADTVQPGALGDLRAFSSQYEKPGSEEALESLRNLIWQSDEVTSDAPLMLLRRLKADNLKGLPAKHEHYIKKNMPPRQAEAYERTIALHGISGPKGTLGVLQTLRQVSLHPALADGSAANGLPVQPEQSARFEVMLEILDGIKAKSEKALIFLESLDLQSTDQLPLFLKRRYGLNRLPMVINGEVATAERQNRVDTFQQETGFDMMLLSPKAGGVGLTLTAANHVIHLSRWWNPAVEDQCSDRVYRIGQTRDVHIYYPMAIFGGDEEHSFDIRLHGLMQRKRQLSQQLLAPPVFTKEDYDELLSGVMK